MLQRYHIARDDQTNRVSIKEFAVLETKSHKRVDYKPTSEDYSLIHQVSFDGDTILAAIGEGRKALISELRSGDFFPIYPCMEIIAEHVTALFNGNPKPSYEVFFDDRMILSTYTAEWKFEKQEVGPEVIVHHSAANSSGFKTSNEGDQVTFDIERGQNGPAAANLTVV